MRQVRETPRNPWQLDAASLPFSRTYQAFQDSTTPNRPQGYTHAALIVMDPVERDAERRKTDGANRQKSVKSGLVHGYRFGKSVTTPVSPGLKTTTTTKEKKSFRFSWISRKEILLLATGKCATGF